jgi:hypothetical protein
VARGTTATGSRAGRISRDEKPPSRTRRAGRSRGSHRRARRHRPGPTQPNDSTTAPLRMTVWARALAVPPPQQTPALCRKSRAPCPRQPARPSCRPGRNSAPTTGRELCRSAAAVPMIATGFAVLGFAASAAGNDILSAREHSLRPLHRLIGVGGRDRQGRVLRLCLELQQPVQGRRQIGASTTSSRQF